MSGERRQRSPGLTIAILTKNEEAIIGRAIDSARWADEVLVVDSESVDRTREIAQAAGAHVVVQPWLGWRDQHQCAVDRAANDWVMKLDADEIITDALRRSIEGALAAAPDPADGFVVERVDEFMGTILPNTRRRRQRDSFVRIFNRTRSRWSPAHQIHEVVEVPGQLHKLEGALLHWRNATIERLVAVYNANTEVEARQILKRDVAGPSALKVAVKPVLRFGWSYVVCSGWRYGMRGFLRAVMQSFSEFLALAKAWEAKHAPPKLDPEPVLTHPKQLAFGDQPIQDEPAPALSRRS